MLDEEAVVVAGVGTDLDDSLHRSAETAKPRRATEAVARDEVEAVAPRRASIGRIIMIVVVMMMMVRSRRLVTRVARRLWLAGTLVSVPFRRPSSTQPRLEFWL